VLPSPLQQTGYAKVGCQEEKCILHDLTVKQLNRCRQNLYANIPAAYQRHNLSEDFIWVELEVIFLSYPDDHVWLFY